jgi:hypothetical protein
MGCLKMEYVSFGIIIGCVISRMFGTGLPRLFLVDASYRADLSNKGQMFIHRQINFWLKVLKNNAKNCMCCMLK